MSYRINFDVLSTMEKMHPEYKGEISDLMSVDITGIRKSDILRNVATEFNDQICANKWFSFYVHLNQAIDLVYFDRI